jgi:hypothetical protein
MEFFFNGYFYLATIALQAICVIHCVRKGRQQTNWIWLIVFLPLIGSLVYIFSEMISRKDISNMQSGVGSVFNPSGPIRKLEENLRFADTFTNRVALADAYLAVGQTDNAVSLYESSLTGNFIENEHVLSQLIIGYFQQKRYQEIPPLAEKIYRQPQFARSRAHILYATALGYLGKSEQAEKEFKSMKSRFSNYEGRLQYGLFLSSEGRYDESQQVFNEMVNEAGHLNAREKRDNRQWFNMAKGELQKIRNNAPVA